MIIKVSRDSVCIGDDIVDNSKAYHLGDDVTYEDLFLILKKDNYFPDFLENNSVWILTAKGFKCIFSYYTKTDKFREGLSEKKLQKICHYSDEVHLEYYSSPIKWKEKIQSMYEGNTYEMWRDGWLEELKYCDYVMALI